MFKETQFVFTIEYGQIINSLRVINKKTAVKAFKSLDEYSALKNYVVIYNSAGDCFDICEILPE